MIYRTLVFTLLSAATYADDKAYCTENTISQDNVACSKAYGNTMAELCINLDCVLECMKEFLLDCQKTVQFFNHDIDTSIVGSRAMCDDLEETNRANAVCNPTFCQNKYLTPEHYQQLNDLSRQGDFRGYKELECGRAVDTLSCIPTTPVGPNCTTDLKALALGLETVKFSMSECGIEQDHPFFQRYGSRDTPCGNPKVNFKCLLTPIMQRISQCMELPSFTLVNSSNSYDQLFARVCSNLECNIECYVNAVGDCYKQDNTFFLEPNAATTTARAMCDDVQKTLTSIRECVISNRTCQIEYSNAIEVANSHLLTGEYTEYKRTLCGATRDFKACVDVDVTDKCPASVAALTRNMYLSGNSYAACGPQDHVFFTRYGGDVKCDTSGHARSVASLMTSVSIMLLALMT